MKKLVDMIRGLRPAGTAHTVVIEKRMTDAELRATLNVDPEASVLRGVLEIVRRVDEQVDARWANPEAPAEERAAAGMMKFAVREVGAQIVAWNEASRAEADVARATGRR